MAKTKRKLAVRRETVRRLDLIPAAELARVAGGTFFDWTDEATSYCDTLTGASVTGSVRCRL